MTEIFMDQMKIGRFIAEIRKQQGLTQRKLAEELGISDKTVSKWECGKGMPDNALMLPLCNILGISVNELLSGEVLTNADYGVKAEENIINLLQKTEEHRRRDVKSTVITIISDVLLVIFFYLIISISTGSGNAFLYFIDIPALVTVLGIVLLVLLSNGLLTFFVKSFRIAFSNKYEPDREETASALRAVSLVFKAAPLAGGLSAIIGFIAVFSQLNDVSAIGKNLAVAILSIFYALLLLLLLLPLRNKLEILMEQQKERR